MQTFTGLEYTKIDIANMFGMDKELFETRLKWVEDNDHLLESLMDQAKESPIQYIKAVGALRDAQNKVPSGHMATLDACASGLQILGVISGCEITCRNTGLIDPKVRADIYTTADTIMKMILGNGGNIVLRDAIKLALMTHFYGSFQEPKTLFGEGEELQAFYETTNKVAPGANYLRNLLISTWQSDVLHHSWTLHDGYHAYVPVMNKIDMEIEVDELNHAQFTHRIRVNEALEQGVANAANVVHSIDGMMVREINRRCNYNRGRVEDTYYMLMREGVQPKRHKNGYFVSFRYAEDWSHRTHGLTNPQREHLMFLMEEALNNKSFPVICNHDAFKAHPNNMNRVREVYRDILIELSYSTIMEDIIEQITGTRPTLVRGHHDIGSLIQHANYHLS
jgi:hypothetical protein